MVPHAILRTNENIALAPHITFSRQHPALIMCRVFCIRQAHSHPIRRVQSGRVQKGGRRREKLAILELDPVYSRRRDNVAEFRPFLRREMDSDFFNLFLLPESISYECR